MTQVSPLEGHDLWAPVYDSAVNPIVLLERRSTLELLGNLRPSTLLDVACGTGYWLRHFDRAGSTVFGIDLSQEMLNEARNSPSLKRRLILAHAECLPVAPSTADLVLCSLSLGYFENLGFAFHEFARVAKPGAYIAVSDVHPYALRAGWKRSFKLGAERYDIAHHVREMDEIKLAAANAGLACTTLRSVHFGLPEFPLFRRAGKERLFWSARALPALFAGLWQNPC
ncbi:MAG: methyltransferase domain-containing protein [Acidobacteriaceae bacterium]|nr:methyltransferase domain-containing protein [Acidobacteriaceae bacterium]